MGTNSTVKGRAKEVQLFMTPDRHLFVRDKSGNKYNIDIIDGSGGYTALLLRTDAEKKQMETVATQARQQAIEEAQETDTMKPAPWYERIINYLK